MAECHAGVTILTQREKEAAERRRELAEKAAADLKAERAV